jgi:hypothetical protein
MKAIRYTSGGTVQIRTSVWAEWQRVIQSEIQPALDQVDTDRARATAAVDDQATTIRRRA